jgi:hypothetical protein
MKIQKILAAVFLGAALIPAGAILAGKGPAKNVLVPAQATFRNTGDQITGDNLGAYVDGVGVSCYVNQTAGSSFPFFMKMLGTKGKMARSLNFDYTNSENTSCDSLLSGPPAESMLRDYAAWLNIGHMGDMPIGTRAARAAEFYTSAGYFWYSGQYMPAYHCDTNVVVMRTDATHWIVTTDTLYPGEILPAAGSTNDPGTWNVVGNISQRLVGSDFAGNYLMSFQMQIYCPNCK